MSERARVTTLEALKRVRAALVKFAENTGAALMNVDSDLQRVSQWLAQDRPAHWKHEVRERDEEVVRAKAEVQKKLLVAAPEPVSVVQERKAVARAQQRADSARERLDATRRWGPRWEKDSLAARGALISLSEAIHGTVPRALDRLDRMLTELERYLQELPPQTTTELAEALDTPSIDATTIARGRGALDPSGVLSPYAALRAFAEPARSRARVPRGHLGLVGWGAGEVSPEHAADLARLGLHADAPGTTLTLGWRALTEASVCLVRLAPSGPDDSGWFLGPLDRPDLTGACWTLPVADVLGHVPSLAPVLRLRQGVVVVLSVGRVLAVVNDAGRDVWTRGG